MNKTIYTALIHKIKNLAEEYIKDIEQTSQIINDTDDETTLNAAMIGNLMAHEEKYLRPLIIFNKSVKLMAQELKNINNNKD